MEVKNCNNFARNCIIRWQLEILTRKEQYKVYGLEVQ